MHRLAIADSREVYWANFATSPIEEGKVNFCLTSVLATCIMWTACDY